MTSRKFRSGTAADRGRVLRFPLPTAPQERGAWGALRRIGPGIVTGAADVDPALVLTATVAGAAFHLSVLWVVLLCVPFLLTVFAVSARLGHETRQGLVDLLRVNYGRRVALACAGLVIVINMAMIIADLMAVSDAFSIILRQPRMYFVAAVAFSIWYILIFHDYRRITHALLWLSLPLFLYVAAAVAASPPFWQVLRGTLLPAIPADTRYVTAVVALIGALLTPYILVWQTSSRGEAAERGGLEPHSTESRTGAFVSVVLAFSVVLAASSVLRGNGSGELTTRMAAEALRPAVGDLGPIAFALGIIGAGMVALPVLVASMCYSIAEAMGWKSGLSEHPWEAKRFYVLISVAMLVATAANFFRLNPVKALYWSQVMAGALTVPILVFILILSNDRRIMRTINSRWQNFWIGAACGGLTAAGLVFLWMKLAR